MYRSVILLMIILPSIVFGSRTIAYIEHCGKAVFALDIKDAKVTSLYTAEKEIESFSIRGDVCLYVNSHREFHYVDLKNKRAVFVMKGNFYYDSKTWGNERYLKVHLSPDAASCLFSFGPSYEIDPDCPGRHYLWGGMKLNHRFTMDISEIGFLNLKEKKFRKVSKSDCGFYAFPVFIQDRILYQADLKIVSIPQNPQEKAKGIPICEKLITDDAKKVTAILSSDSKFLYFVMLDITQNYIRKIYQYDTESGLCELVQDKLEVMKIQIDDVYDYDPISKRILFVDNERIINLYDLKEKGKKIIYKCQNPIKEMFFID